MTQNAVVTKIVNSTTAEVTVLRGTACGGNCSSCGGTCNYKNQINTLALNKIAAAVGDKVTVESRTSKVLGAAVLVYILPLVLFFVGYTISILLSLDETPSIIISLVCFFLGIFGVVFSQRSSRHKRNITCEIISIQR
jgi:sigma-E factor negative regulatory protein RseC